MATFTFETMTAADALGITSSDSVSFSTGTAVLATVVYGATGDILMTLGDKTLDFGAALTQIAESPGLAFPDGSVLYIGDATANVGALQTIAMPSAIFGGDGDDILRLGSVGGLAQGNQGDDNISTQGQATLYGGQGNDTLNVVELSHSHFLQGNKGDDLLQGGSADTLLGGQGNDTITGSGILDGNLGNDTINGSGQLLGEGGNDTLASAGTGHDTLSGGDGDDSIVGASAGSASISGDAGNDTISITGGAQLISGGAGADKFIFGAGTLATGTVPAILDWTGSEDTLSFLGFTPNPSDYTAITAPDYATAVSMATTLTIQNHFSFVAVQVGPDVILFAGASGGLSSVVDLVGRSLTDFNPSHNLI